MRLVVVTPQALVVDRDVVHVRAEDASGSFGVLDHHADLLTALAVSVLAYRDLARREHFIALRGGILTVTGRQRIEVLSREAVASDDLEQLEHDVLARFRRTAADEERARHGVGRLEAALLSRMSEYLHTERGAGEIGLPPWSR